MTTILIGLGEFGRQVLDLMESDPNKNIVFHGLSWEVKTEFDSNIFKRRLLDSLEPLPAYLGRKAFNFYLVADIGEPAAALHLLELAKSIKTMENDNLLFMRDASQPGQLVGFTTLSERVGHTDEYSELEISVAAWYFKEADEDRGTPFDRNYIYMTPGGRKHVLEKTSRVLYQRMLLEAKFFPKDQMRRLLVAKQNLGEPLGHAFSSFSFLQIPRLSELQRYHVRFIFEHLALELALNSHLPQNVKHKILELWLKTLDLPVSPGKGFPTDRVREVFLRTEESQILELKGDPETILRSMDTELFKFIEVEFEIIKGVFSEGIDMLLQVPRLYGSFRIYVEFLNELKTAVESWVSDTETSNRSEPEDISSDLAEIDKKIAAIKSSRVLSLHVFTELKERLIKLVIQSSHLEQHIRQRVTAKIAEYLRHYLDPTTYDGHPIRIIDERISDIQHFITGLSESRQKLHERTRSVSSLLDSYYIRCPLDMNAFQKVVTRLDAKLFPGSGASTIWEQYQQRVFVPWQESLGGETQLDHKEQSFLRFLHDAGKSFQDSPATTGALENFSVLEREFHQELARRLLTDLDTIMGRTFFSSGSSKSMPAFLLFWPEGSPQDFLSEVVEKLKRNGAIDVPVDRDDTLGSVIAIREWYFLGLEYLAFWPNLKAHIPATRDEIAKQVFIAQSPDLSVSDAVQLTPRQKKLIVNIISETLSESVFLTLWNKHFKESPDTVFDETHILHLTERVSISEILNTLSEADLRKLARDLETVAGTSKDKNIENLIAVILAN